MYIFGYGSLMSAESAKETLLRDVSLPDLIPATLISYKRVWSLKELVVSELLHKQITAVFLDIDTSEGTEMNGVLIKINQDELERLIVREKNYDCLDVTNLIRADTHAMDSSTRIITFISKQDERVKPGDKDVYVLGRYIAKVEEACIALGDDFLNVYHATTQEPPFEVISGDYTFVTPML